MDSLWLTDERGVAWREGVDKAPADHRELRCGRDHESWLGWRYRQTFDGVLVEEYVAEVPATRRESLGVETTPIDGHSIWYRPQRTEGVDQIVPATWSTIVDERFLVIADTEDLLRAALRRPRGSIAEQLLSAMEVSADAVEVVYHKFRRRPLRAAQGPAGIVGGNVVMESDWMGMLVTDKPLCVEWWGLAQQPRKLVEDCSIAHRMRGDTHVYCQTLASPIAADFGVYIAWQFTMAMTFGLMIFV